MVLNRRRNDDDEILDTGVNNYPNLGSKDTVKKLAEDYANYNYDTFAGGDSYKALEKRYQTGGQKAMQDTVGQVSARTGGLASSYATVAGQQTYNDWMGNLESAARALYDSERQEMGDRYALANSMYLQERDEQRYADELAYNRGRDQLADERYIEERDYNRAWNEDERTYNRAWNEDERTYNRAWNEDERTYNRAWNEDERTYNRAWNEDERTYNRAWNEDERTYNRAWNEDERTYNRAWNEDERDYNRSESSRLEGEGKAYNTVVALINAGTPIDKIDPALIAQTGYDPSHFDAMEKSYTDKQTKDSLQDLMDIMDRGGTVTLQQWKDAGGLDDDYKMYASIGANADAEEASAKAAEDANEAILLAFTNGKSLDEIDSELIKTSGMSMALLTAMDEYYAKERQNAADAKAAADATEAEENATEEMMLRLQSGESLEEIGSGLMASTGKGDKYWAAYERILGSGEAKEAAEFYEIKYEDAANWMAEMEEATSYEEAMDIAALVASSSGNWDFADELLTSWMNKYKNKPAG